LYKRRRIAKKTPELNSRKQCGAFSWLTVYRQGNIIGGFNCIMALPYFWSWPITAGYVSTRNTSLYPPLEDITGPAQFINLLCYILYSS